MLDISKLACQGNIGETRSARASSAATRATDLSAGDFSARVVGNPPTRDVRALSTRWLRDSAHRATRAPTSRCACRSYERARRSAPNPTRHASSPARRKETATADDSSTLPRPACYKPRSMHRAKHSEVTAPARFAGLALIALAALGCESGGVGDPCTPEDEFFEDFSGFSLGPTVRHNFPCEIPSFGGYTTVPVEPQLEARSPAVSVYCSCRCGGDDPNARYCECPSGFECLEIVVSPSDEQQTGLAGSYCVRSGTNVDPATVPSAPCEVDDPTCGTPPSPAQ
jgi:hypothetical protein